MTFHARRLTTVAMSIAAACTLAAPAGAVILNGGVSARPSTSYIGVFNGGTAVAVGPRTILTAAHVGGSSGDRFRLGGSSYTATETITSPTADLMRITLDRDLPGWYPIADGGLKKGAKLIIAGFGITSDGRNRAGFNWSDERAEVWGTNRLDSFANGSLWFKFDQRSGSQEAILTPGDSGGAVFITGPGGELQLAGINRGVYLRARGRATFGDTSVATNLTANSSFLAGLAGLSAVPAPAAAPVFALAGCLVSRRRRGS